MAGLSGRTAVVTGVGGALWALTPLRQPIFGAGGDPDEGVLAFRGYNLLIVVVVACMTVGVVEVRRRHEFRERLFIAGWWLIAVGHTLLIAGSLPAVVLGGASRDFVMGAQDVGFIGALVAAVGALLLGASAIRKRQIPRPAALCFLAALPAGVLGIILLDAAGVPEDYLGLPLTLLYGGAWLRLAATWAGTSRAPAKEA